MLNKIKAIIDKSYPLITNLSNASAVLNQMKNINWCGFYLVKENTLFLGPFQGDVACSKIDIGKGVCGTAFKNKESIIVPDVSKFNGHIACSSVSKSEIVVPIIKNNKVVAVIDIDSPVLNRFSQSDKKILEKVGNVLKDLF